MSVRCVSGVAYVYICLGMHICSASTVAFVCTYVRISYSCCMCTCTSMCYLYISVLRTFAPVNACQP